MNNSTAYVLIANDNLYTPRTQGMANKLPRWMKVRDKDSNFQQIVNYAGARKLDDLHEKISAVIKNKFIGLADIHTKYIAFKTKISNFEGFELKGNPDNYTFKYKGKYIPITLKEVEFATSKKELAYYNTKTKIVYFAQPYKHNITEDDNNLKVINKETKKEYYLKKELIRHDIWNPFDEFAYLFDLKRLPEEDNKSFKERILDVNKNPGNSTKEGLRNHIARELGIDKSEVVIEELCDDSYRQSMMYPDGVDEKLISIVRYIKENIPLFWNELTWDEGYWDIVDKNGNGYDFIPLMID